MPANPVTETLVSIVEVAAAAIEIGRRLGVGDAILRQMAERFPEIEELPAAHVAMMSARAKALAPHLDFDDDDKTRPGGDPHASER